MKAEIDGSGIEGGRAKRLFGAIGSFFAKPENVFIIAWLIVAVCAAVFARPMTGFDEAMHIARAEQVAEGGLLPQEISVEDCDTSLVLVADVHRDRKLYGGQTDSAIYELLKIALDCNREFAISGSGMGDGVGFPAWSDPLFATSGEVGSGSKVTWPFPNTALNSALAYLPHALGFWFARLVTTSPWATISCMRVFGVLAFGAIVYLAIKKCPFGKWLMVAVALSPNSVTVNSMVSADTMTNAFMLLYLAIVLRFLVQEKPGKGDWALLAVSLCGLALLKMPYICFGLLLFVLVGVKPSLRDAVSLKRFTVIGVGALLLFGAWVLCTRGIESYVIWGDNGIDPDMQSTYVMAHPLSLVAAILRTILGGDFGLYDVSGYDLSAVPLWATSALYLFAFLAECRAPAAVPRPRIVAASLIGITLLAVLAVGLALYLTFTAVGGDTVSGLQPRYFLPLLFPMMVGVYLWFIGQEALDTVGTRAFNPDGSVAGRYGKPCIAIIAMVILMLCLYYRVYGIWLPG